jgi:hypothetical protein
MGEFHRWNDEDSPGITRQNWRSSDGGGRR